MQLNSTVHWLHRFSFCQLQAALMLLTLDTYHLLMASDSFFSASTRSPSAAFNAFLCSPCFLSKFFCSCISFFLSLFFFNSASRFLASAIIYFSLSCSRAMRLASSSAFFLAIWSLYMEWADLASCNILFVTGIAVTLPFPWIRTASLTRRRAQIVYPVQG